jgi:AraC-like DNA-binding protein
MVHQVNIFLLLLGAAQGWLLSLWFFRHRPTHLSNRYLGLLLVVVSMQLTSKVISKLWLMEHVYFFYSLSYKLPYLVGPALFLFVRARAGNKFRYADLIHFLPFAIGFVTVEAWLLFRFPFLHPYAEAALQLISLGAYCYLAQRNATKELREFILAIVLCEAVVIVTLALMVMYYGRFPDVRILFTVLTAVMYWISYRVISKHTPFEENERPVVAMSASRLSKYAHSSLKIEEADRVERELADLMTRQKVYLDPDLTIEKLAQRLSTSRHHLSQIMNERLRRPYNEYINNLRLDECSKRLADPSNFKFTIAAIALDSGFNSISSFNDIFKKRFGVTPSKFREPYLKKMTA